MTGIDCNWLPPCQRLRSPETVAGPTRRNRRPRRRSRRGQLRCDPDTPPGRSGGTCGTDMPYPTDPPGTPRRRGEAWGINADRRDRASWLFPPCRPPAIRRVVPGCAGRRKKEDDSSKVAQAAGRVGGSVHAQHSGDSLREALAGRHAGAALADGQRSSVLGPAYRHGRPDRGRRTRSSLARRA